MPIPTVAFATDEDVALRAGDDFIRIAPLDQALAAGGDGAFASGDRWNLTSAAVDFEAQAVEPGMVTLLSLAKQGLTPDTQALAVAAVSAGTLTLRRKGLEAGVGQPPARPIGESGIKFTVATLKPQLLRATYDLARRFGIDDRIAGRSTADLYDADEIRDACVLTVLWKLYGAAAQGGSPESKDGGDAALWARARGIKGELDEVLGRLTLHWQSCNQAGVPAAPSTRFSTRLSR